MGLDRMGWDGCGPWKSAMAAQTGPSLFFLTSHTAQSLLQPAGMGRVFPKAGAKAGCWMFTGVTLQWEIYLLKRKTIKKIIVSKRAFATALTEFFCYLFFFLSIF